MGDTKAVRIKRYLAGLYIVLCCLHFGASWAGDISWTPEVNRSDPKIESRLKQWAEEYRLSGAPAVQTLSEDMDVTVVQDKVEAMLEVAPEQTLDRSELISYGVEIVSEYGNLLKVKIPVSASLNLTGSALMIEAIAGRKGDLNRSGSISLGDVTRLVDFILQRTSLSEYEQFEADMDDSDEVNMGDALLAIDTFLGI